jgi:hypothetical protein
VSADPSTKKVVGRAAALWMWSHDGSSNVMPAARTVRRRGQGNI